MTMTVRAVLVAGASMAFAASFSLTAAAVTPIESEIGYETGALAVSDITHGRLARAENVLAAQNAEDARDPARLINLGIVYARTGRIADARNAFMAAARQPEQKLILSDGREVSSRKVVQEQLSLLELRDAMH